MDPDRRRALREGFLAGVLGYASVAVYYGLLNVISGRSFFFTARELGLQVLGAAWAADASAVGYAPILAYNAVHLVAFLAVGMVAAWLLLEAERHPEFWFFFFLLGVGGLIVTESLFLLLAVPVTEVLSWWSVAGANAVAALAMGGYLYRAHAGLRRTVEELGGRAL